MLSLIAKQTKSHAFWSRVLSLFNIRWILFCESNQRIWWKSSKFIELIASSPVFVTIALDFFLWESYVSVFDLIKPLAEVIVTAEVEPKYCPQECICCKVKQILVQEGVFRLRNAKLRKLSCVSPKSRCINSLRQILSLLKAVSHYSVANSRVYVLHSYIISVSLLFAPEFGPPFNRV